MGYYCCAPGCKVGNRAFKRTGEKVSMFRFPTDTELRKAWIRAIPRENFTLTPYTRICGKHFYENDFETTSADSHLDRQQRRESVELNQSRLKPSAVPRIFSGLSHYLTKPAPIKRSTSAATASERLEKDKAKLQDQNEEFLLQDSCCDLDSLKDKINEVVIPSGYIKCLKESSLEFHYITYDNGSHISPKLMASLVVGERLDVHAFVCSISVPQETFRHLMSSDSLSKVSQLCNILAFCKNLLESSNINNNETFAKSAVAALEQCKANLEENESQDEGLPLIQFVSEQLQLLFLDKKGRRYSPRLLTTSFLWQLTSNSLYKKLSEFFILPSVRRLQQVSSDCNVDTKSIDLQYLKQRTVDLSEGEKVVTLLIDEVYTAQRVEYCNGAFIGLTEEGQRAKTVLTFMVQSVCKKYKDVVCLVPIEKISTQLLRTFFNKVMQSLDEIFFVVAVSVDNHVCNRKLFMDLCGSNKLSNSIAHPSRNGERLFLLFDFTQNFKNIFNNFVNKKRFHIPHISGAEHILGEQCTAEFAHIKRLYTLEEHKPLKVAFALKKASLNPSNIARTSPQHALSVFSESTANGLLMYADTNPGFKETAKFLQFVCNVWKVMSVKTPFKGMTKNDEMCMPMKFTSIEEEKPANLRFLKSAKDILLKWQQSGTSGLTDQTFLACIQTMSAMPELAQYLHDKIGLKYVLPGKFTSDPIEGRFGWYRQVSGGNFFMSIKQLLEAEKKIRKLSLLQQHGILAASKLHSLDSVSLGSGKLINEDSSNVSWLERFFSEVTLDDLSETDANVAYFVSGYIARSISRRRRCSPCKVLLVKSDDCPAPAFESEDHVKLFEIANRGGLSVPTEFCFSATTLAVHYYSAVISDVNAKEKLWTAPNQRSMFIQALKKIVEASNVYRGAFKQMCSAGHSNFELILQTAFNCFAKNELKRFNAPGREEPEKMARKVRKLTSGSGKKTAS